MQDYIVDIFGLKLRFDLFAGRGCISWAIGASPSGEVDRLLLRRRAQAARVRTHGKREPGKPSL